MSTKEISAAAQALGRRGGLKSLGAKTPAELSAFGKAAAQRRWAAFGKGSQSGEVPPGIGDLRTPEERAVHVEHVLSAPIAKPRRALPKAGTVNALVLAAMSIKPLTAEQIYERADGIPAGSFDRVRNALSALRSGGHVVSEPHPNSAKMKLWRLA